MELKMKIWMASVLVLAINSGVAAPANTTKNTIALNVEGLNCALCSEKMRNSLKQAAGASDIEPKLECGKIYLEVPLDTKVNEGAISFTLLANGFNFKGTTVENKSMSEIRATEKC